MEVYLDNAATTRCSCDAAALVAEVSTTDYGNPSSMHAKGVAAERYVKNAASQIAKTLRCGEKEIVFTSGGTESNNLAILGGAWANRRRGNHLITTQIEHPSVLNTMKFLEEQGFEVSYLSVDKNGEISREELADTLRDDTILVSVMAVNNEIGALEPVAEAGKTVHEKDPGILFHVDAVQAYGKYRFAPGRMDIDMLSASSHKIHGPKGVGFLYIRDHAKVRPATFGGGQQRGMRSGTINAPGIAGMGEAARAAYAGLDEKTAKMQELRAHFTGRLLELEDVRINGRTDGASAPHIVSASFPGIKSEVLLHALEERGIFVSAGSACASGHPGESRTLTAIGLDGKLRDSALRFSLSVYTTASELDYTVDALAELLPVLRRYRHF